MPGGSQSHLLLCSDGEFYVVKFLGNPQHECVLFNEWVATRLAAHVGLLTATVTPVEVSPRFIMRNTQLKFQLPSGNVSCLPGLHLGVKYLGIPGRTELFDFLPAAVSGLVKNRESVFHALVFDKWLGNNDTRQFVYRRMLDKSPYTAFIIDNANCFNGGDWDFRTDGPRLALVPDRAWYREVTDFRAFEPFLASVEALESSTVRSVVWSVPGAWVTKTKGEVSDLTSRIIERRTRVRYEVRQFVQQRQDLFPRFQSPSTRTDEESGLLSSPLEAFA